jgi:hypothetical protein
VYAGAYERGRGGGGERERERERVHAGKKITAHNILKRENARARERERGRERERCATVIPIVLCRVPAN